MTYLVAIDGFRFNLEDGGRLIVRFSGAEPLPRVYCETIMEIGRWSYWMRVES